jgi:DNA-binding NtrC family response regulator
MNETPSTTDAPRKSAAAGKFKLLVVDDERDVLQVVLDILQESGYEAVGTASATDALQKVKRQKFDGLVLDVYMPEMSGMLFHAKLRLIDAELARRTIFMSGYVSRDELREHLIGKPSFLEKPFKAEQLTAHVERVLPEVPRR